MPVDFRFTWNPPDTAFRVRLVFDRAGFAESAVLKLLDVSELPGPRQRNRALPLYLWRTRGGSPLETLVRLFLLHQPVALTAVRVAIEPTSVEEWAAAGLLVVELDDVRAAIELTPYDSLILASDWPEGNPVDPVMGLAATSRMLAQLTVRRPVPRALDLGTGCGVLAFLASRHADRVSATDLNPRAVHLARFNAQLNGITNVEFHEGDWFGPIRGQSFDRIVCNSPFVLAPGRGLLHTHSGRRSDHLCRDLVRSAPASLNEGGYFQLTASWAQKAGRDWQERLAGWFVGSGCDAWVLHADTEDPASFALHRIEEMDEAPEPAARRFEEWMTYYARERIEGIGSGIITLRRNTRRPIGVRFDRFPGVDALGGAAIERGFAVRDFLAATLVDRDLLAARLCHADHLRWEQRHDATPTSWTPSESRVRMTQGLGFVGNVDPAVAEFLVRCRGDRPLSEYLTELAEARGEEVDRMIPGFLSVVRRLLERGYLYPKVE